MLTLDELLRKTDEYVSGRTSLEEFDSWFESNIVDRYVDPVLRGVYEAIQGALAEYFFDYIGQQVLKHELADAIRPFLLRSNTYVLKFAPSRSWVLSSSGASSTDFVDAATS